MAKVKAFAIAGIDLWFWSGDHEPPHFHASRPGEWEVRVFFLLPKGKMLDMKWPRNANAGGKYRRQLESCAEKHRSELLQEWETCQPERK